MRVVSLAPSNTEILFAIGAGDQVVATTSLCDHPEKARELPGIGGWSQGLDVEKVVEMSPDVALASDDLQDEIVDELSGRGIDVVQVSPHTLEEVYDSVEVIGRAVGREQVARELVKGMKARLRELSVEGARIYCEEWMRPPMASGNWVPGLVESIQAEYFLSGGERSREFDLEELARFDPEYIFLNVCGAGKKVNRDELLERDGWQDIEAVRRGEVYVIDDALLNRPGPRLVEGAAEISMRVE
ncbi:MAG: cobalamin-binding protein [Candidatus Nanohaloarchaea archaeon]